ncbi:MAG: helix-hairpin-helix domain-containing protein [Clostridia bacterium]
MKKVIILIVSTIFLISTIFVILNIYKYNKEELVINNETIGTNEIYISGEVNEPGKYNLDNNLTIKQVLDIIGGVTINADLNKIKLDDSIERYKKIVVYKKENITEENVIDINKATKEELINLPSIGEVTADKIIKFRNNKKIENYNELLTIIGESKYEKIVDLIVI